MVVSIPPPSPRAHPVGSPTAAPSVGNFDHNCSLSLPSLGADVPDHRGLLPGGRLLQARPHTPGACAGPHAPQGDARPDQIAAPRQKSPKLFEAWKNSPWMRQPRSKKKRCTFLTFFVALLLLLCHYYIIIIILSLLLLYYHYYYYIIIIIILLLYYHYYYYIIILLLSLLLSLLLLLS